jgi:serine/threonine protein kinase
VKNSRLEVEAAVYKELQGGPGIPKFYYYFTEGNYNGLVLELLGKNLEQLLKVCQRKFSVSTGLALAIQMVVTFI